MWQSRDSLAASLAMLGTGWWVQLWLQHRHAAGLQQVMPVASLRRRAPSHATCAAHSCASRCCCEMLIIKRSTAEWAGATLDITGWWGHRWQKPSSSVFFPHLFLISANPLCSAVKTQNKPQKQMCWCWNARAEPKRKPGAGWGLQRALSSCQKAEMPNWWSVLASPKFNCSGDGFGALSCVGGDA